MFEAVDEDLDARVAIKILLGQFVDNDDLTERFTREGRLLRRVDSPHVVAVHDVGALEDGRPYLVLDLADRGTLQDRLVTMDPSCAGPESVHALIDALAAGLDAMHAQDVAHRDVKPANILVRSHTRGRRRVEPLDPMGGDGYPLVGDDEILQLGDLGLAKDLDQSDLPSMLGGTPGYQAPEQRIAGARIGPAVDVYAATVILWRVLTWSPMPDAEDPHRFDSVDLGWARFFAKGVAPEPGDRFQSMTEWRTAALQMLEQEPSELSITGFTEIDPLTTAACPYKGLAPFQVGDEDQFVGREDLIDDLDERTAPGQVLVVGGPSGSGKSSLLRAGLIPSVQDRMASRPAGGRVVLMVPGREPLAELAYRLSTGETTLSADALRDEPRHARRAAADSGSLLLVVDQFEELFTLCPDEEERDAFLAVLETLTDTIDSATGIAIGVRSDFYSACARYQWLADRINDNQVLVGPMSSEDLRRSIVEPAQRAGVQVETALVDRVLADGGTDVGSLPLVSHALFETWSRRSGNRMLLEDYEAVGGVAGAIAKTADDVLDQRLTDQEREGARRLLLRLVTPGEGTSDSRRRIEHDELDHDPEPETMRRVAAELTAARLLTADDQSIEIAHEALIRSWPRMQGWLAEERDNIRTRERISRAADEWVEADRNPDLLIRGTRLATTVEWLAAHPGQLNRLESSYVEAAETARRNALDAERERADRLRKLRRRGAAALGGLAAAAIVASVVAWSALGDAQDSEAEAQDSFSAALGSRADALAPEDPFLALRVAAESIARSADPEPDADQALIRARQVLAEGQIFPVGEPVEVGDSLSVAVSSDGATFAIGGRDGWVQLWDAVTRRPLSDRLTGHSDGVNKIVFGPSGDRLYSVGGESGSARLVEWPITPDGLGDPVVVAELDDVIWSVDVTSDGTTAATASEDGTIRLWDLNERRAMGDPLAQRTGDFTGVGITPDDRIVVAGNGAGEVSGWDITSRAQVFGPIVGQAMDGVGADVWDIVFSDDGLMALAGSGFVIDTVEVDALVEGTETNLAQPFDAGTPMRSVAFDSTNGILLAGTRGQGRVVPLDLATGEQLEPTVAQHRDDILDVAVGGDTMVTLSDDQTARTWLVGAIPAGVEARTELGVVTAAATRPDAGVAIGTDDGRLMLTFPPDASLSIDAGPGTVRSVVFIGDTGRTVLTGSETGAVAFWDIDGGAQRASVAAHDGPVWAAAASGDGRVAATAGDDRQLVIWDTTDLTPSTTVELPATPRALAISPDGEEIAVAHGDGVVRFFATSDGASSRPDLPADDDALLAVVYHPDGQLLATGAAEERIREWSLDTGEPRSRPLGAHAGGASSLAYADGGRLLLVGDGRGQIHVWNTMATERVGVLNTPATMARGEPVFLLIPSASQRIFAAASSAGWQREWNVLDVGTACELSENRFDPTSVGAESDPVACSG